MDNDKKICILNIILILINLFFPLIILILLKPVNLPEYKFNIKKYYPYIMSKSNSENIFADNVESEVNIQNNFFSESGVNEKYFKEKLLTTKTTSIIYKNEDKNHNVTTMDDSSLISPPANYMKFENKLDTFFTNNMKTNSITINNISINSDTKVEDLDPFKNLVLSGTIFKGTGNTENAAIFKDVKINKKIISYISDKVNGWILTDIYPDGVKISSGDSYIIKNVFGASKMRSNGLHSEYDSIKPLADKNLILKQFLDAAQKKKSRDL